MVGHTSQHLPIVRRPQNPRQILQLGLQILLRHVIDGGHAQLVAGYLVVVQVPTDVGHRSAILDDAGGSQLVVDAVNVVGAAAQLQFRLSGLFCK